MKTRISPLELVDYSFLDILVNTIPCDQANRQEIIQSFKLDPFDIDLEIKKAKDEPLFFITVEMTNIDSTEPEEVKQGYRFGIRINGVFRIRPNDDGELIDETVINDLILHSAVSMLINMARGQLAAVTTKGFYGPLMLPLVDMQSVISDYVAKVTRAEATDSSVSLSQPE